MNPQAKVCNCPHHKVIPLSIILIGLAVLLGATSYLTGTTVNILVGILLIVIGGTKLKGRNCKCCSR